MYRILCLAIYLHYSTQQGLRGFHGVYAADQPLSLDEEYKHHPRRKELLNKQPESKTREEDKHSSEFYPGYEEVFKLLKASNIRGRSELHEQIKKSIEKFAAGSASFSGPIGENVLRQSLKEVEKLLKEHAAKEHGKHADDLFKEKVEESEEQDLKTSEGTIEPEIIYSSLGPSEMEGQYSESPDLETTPMSFPHDATTTSESVQSTALPEATTGSVVYTTKDSTVPTEAATTVSTEQTVLLASEKKLIETEGDTDDVITFTDTSGGDDAGDGHYEVSGSGSGSGVGSGVGSGSGDDSEDGDDEEVSSGEVISITTMQPSVTQTTTAAQATTEASKTSSSGDGSSGDGDTESSGGTDDEDDATTTTAPQTTTAAPTTQKSTTLASSGDSESSGTGDDDNESGDVSTTPFSTTRAATTISSSGDASGDTESSGDTDDEDDGSSTEVTTAAAMTTTEVTTQQLTTTLMTIFQQTTTQPPVIPIPSTRREYLNLAYRGGCGLCARKDYIAERRRVQHLKDTLPYYNFVILAQKFTNGIYTAELILGANEKISFPKFTFVRFHAPWTCGCFSNTANGRYLLVGSERSGRLMLDSDFPLHPVHSYKEVLDVSRNLRDSVHLLTDL